MAACLRHGIWFCSMARLDRVKNLTGLAEWFAGNERLRKLVNLVIVGALLEFTPQSLCHHGKCVARVYSLISLSSL